MIHLFLKPENISVINWEFFELITLLRCLERTNICSGYDNVWIWRDRCNEREQTCDLTTILSTRITDFFGEKNDLDLNLILEP